MASDLFDRLMNASPASIAGWVKRSLGRPASPRAALPAWERITAGPLAGREILIDRRSNGAWEDMIAGRFDAEIYSLLAAEPPARHRIVWDVGAHLGFHTLGFAAFAGSNGRVVAFEPNSTNRERLEQNLKKNPDLAERCEVLPYALSDRDGESSLVISRDIESGASSMSFLDGTRPAVDPGIAGAWNRVAVQVRRADGLVREGNTTPDIIKIDVEGAELLVLRGAERIIRSSRPLLIVEAHSAMLTLEVQCWLHAQGYEVRALADLAPSRVLLSARPARQP